MQGRRVSLSLTAWTAWLIAVAAFLWLSGTWFGVSAQTPPTDKFDAQLKTVMLHPAGVRTMGRSIGMRRDATARSPVKVLVLVTDGGHELEARLAAHDGKITSRHGQIVVIQLPFDELAGVAALSTVRWVEASQPLLRTNDLARAAAGANVAAAVAASPGLTGRGVLVGIIDSGIDQTNTAFNDDEGKTRIGSVWVQSDTGHPTMHPTGFDYGTEISSALINQGGLPCLDLDTKAGHGTHVSGTAAGRDATYPGMAPGATLFVVNNDGPSDGDIWQGLGTGATLDAYTYLLNKRDADSLKRPLVVNESQGTAMGPHDGSTLFEQAIQSMIATRNLVVCISAGNYQDDRLHATAQIDAKASRTAIAEVPVASGGAMKNAIDIWIKGGFQPRLSIEQWSLAGALLGKLDADITGTQTGTYNFMLAGNPNGSTVTVAKEMPSALNGDNRILLTFDQPDQCYFLVKLTNDSDQGGMLVDFYMQRDTPGFKAADGAATVTAAGTLGMPGTTPGAITVGSYASRATYTDADGNTQPNSPPVLGELSNFSALGPVRNNAFYRGNNLRKPDIVGPGEYIISQRSAGALYTPDMIIDKTHAAMKGTSMSSPVVAGCVALLLDENPTLTADQVKTLLFASARKDDFTKDVPNDNWGYGKIDLNGAWSQVVSPTPEITSVAIDASAGTIQVVGKYFAASSQVLLNFQGVPAERVDRTSHTTLTIAYDPNVLDPTKYLYSVTVRNTKAAAGRTDVTYWLNDPNTTPYNPPAKTTGVGGGSKGCFIATAAYGSYLDPHVVVLRDFRDHWLLTNRPGSAFVDYYYRVSPPIASCIAAHPTLRFATRVALTPIILGIEYPVAPVVLLLLPVAFVAWRRRRGAAAA